MKLGKKIKKTGVVSGVCDGFIGNRMIEQYSRQAGFLLEEGATPQQVDRRSRSSAWRWGRSAWATWPATTSAGTSASAATSRSRTCATRKIADLLCELGRFGQKTGAGWYDYEPGKRDAIPIRRSTSMIDEATAASSASRRARSATRRSSSAASTRWSTRARRSSRKASRSAPPTSTWSTSPATASRCTAAARCSTPTPSGLLQRRARR